MNHGLEKRYARLRSQVGGRNIVLTLPDGSLQTIAGDNRHFFSLWAVASEQFEANDAGRPITPSPLDRELTWLRSATSISETGGMFSLLSAMLSGPNREGEC